MCLLQKDFINAVCFADFGTCGYFVLHQPLFIFDIEFGFVLSVFLAGLLDPLPRPHKLCNIH